MVFSNRRHANQSEFQTIFTPSKKLLKCYFPSNCSILCCNLDQPNNHVTIQKCYCYNIVTSTCTQAHRFILKDLTVYRVLNHRNVLSSALCVKHTAEKFQLSVLCKGGQNCEHTVIFCTQKAITNIKQNMQVQSGTGKHQSYVENSRTEAAEFSSGKLCGI